MNGRNRIDVIAVVKNDGLAVMLLGPGVVSRGAIAGEGVRWGIGD